MEIGFVGNYVNDLMINEPINNLIVGKITSICRRERIERD